MPFALPSTFSWFKHRLLATKRVIFRRENNYFVGEYKHTNLIALIDLDGSPLLCPICGFSMAELALDQGWSVRACSATGFKDILGNTGFGLQQANLIKSWTNEKAKVNNNLSISSK